MVANGTDIVHLFPLIKIKLANTASFILFYWEQTLHEVAEMMALRNYRKLLLLTAWKFLANLIPSRDVTMNT